MKKSEKIKAILEMCQHVNATYQVRYADYEKDQFTIPVILTPERIKLLTNDFSLYEIRINIKP